MHSFQTNTVKHDNLVELICTGTLTLDESVKLGEQLRYEISKEPSIDRALVDVSHAKVKIDIMHRFMLGEYIAKNLLDLKIAIVADADVIDKMVEDTAVNRGASLYVTCDRLDALNWLSE